MANKKIFADLTELTTAAAADVLPIVDDTVGTPTTKRITVSNLMAQAPVQTADISGFASTSLSFQTYTASGTPLAFDLTSAANGKVVTVNESSNVYVTVPSGLGTGFNCTFVQLGAGKVIVQAGSGVVVGAYTPGVTPKNTTSGQYAALHLVPTSANNYVVFGESTTSPFVNSYSVSMDGVDDHVDIGNIGEMNSTSNLTIAWWMRNSSSSDMIFRNSSGQLFFRSEATGIFSRINNVSNTLGSASYNDGNWRHFAFTYSSGTGILYVNGSSAGSATNYGATSASTTGDGFKLGFTSGTLNGNIDEIGIWSSTLSAAEVTEIYNSGTPTDLLSDAGNYTSSSNLEHYWRGGDSDAGSGTTMTDIGNSSGLVDGTLTNGASFVANTP